MHAVDFLCTQGNHHHIYLLSIVYSPTLLMIKKANVIALIKTEKIMDYKKYRKR